MNSQTVSTKQLHPVGLSRRILWYIILTSSILAMVTISIHYYHVKSLFIDTLQEHLQVIEDGLLPALVTEAYDDSYEELYMMLQSVRKVPGVQFVELFSNIPGHEQHMHAGDSLLPYDEIRQWDLPHFNGQPKDGYQSYLKAHVSHQYIHDKLARESNKMLLIAGHHILILSIIYFAIFHFSVTRHLKFMTLHLSRITLSNLNNPMKWAKPRHSSNHVDELDIIAIRINELCKYLHDEIIRREGAIAQVESDKAFYKQVVEDQTEFIVRFDVNNGITFVNQAFCRYMQMNRQSLLGNAIVDFLDESEQRKAYIVSQLLTPQDNVLYEDIVLKHPVNGSRLLRWKLRGYFDDDEQLSFVQTTGSDITEHAQTLDELRLRNLAVEAAPYGMVITDPTQHDNPVIYVNPAFELMTGYPCEEIVGRNMRFLHLGDSDQPGLNQLRKAIQNQTQVAVTLRNYRKDGTQYWVEIIVVPLHDQKGCITHFISIQTDVTQRRQADERQNLLINELDHRVKNVLATVVALASQSIETCTDLQSFKEVFNGRLQALARAHEALAKEKWDGIQLEELVGLILEHQLCHDSDRITISGSNVRLLSRLSSPLSMTLHELLTNAMKYGALKNPIGRLSLSWELIQDHSGQTVQITWQEYCPVTCGCCDGSHRPGTGMRLIQGLVSYEMNGTVDHAFTPDGLCCQLTFPNHKNIT